ncbi:hypothetical protein K458DRAFT_402597 [Lentithecium fluviatile CBS 122367]|uniref:Uncharacterized protein n=1 Tax=Lentithecium fluviatile CBS 122367 TaxID=1168545 RepID=A0A6G1J771_9PLEO|nr:hypothetical protein K458DRAFT_402597 [Lentithecium fluviatile CBS 122367]
MPPPAKFIGDWTFFPLSIKTNILKHNLTFNHPITTKNVKAGILDVELLRYRFVSRSFGAEPYRPSIKNSNIQLWPESSAPFVFRFERQAYIDTEAPDLDKPHILRSHAPPRLRVFPAWKVNHYLSRLDFYPLGQHISLLPELQDQPIPSDRRLAMLTGNKQQVMDTWLFWKNVALGKYGFPALERIRVFFDAEPQRMRAFGKWRIKVKSGDQWEVILLGETFWLESLQAALEVLPEPGLGVDEPGFELVRRGKKRLWEEDEDEDEE